MATKHPDYAILAARIAVSNLHKETKKVFSGKQSEAITDTNKYSFINAGLNSCIIQCFTDLCLAIQRWCKICTTTSIPRQRLIVPWYRRTWMISFKPMLQNSTQPLFTIVITATTTSASRLLLLVFMFYLIMIPSCWTIKSFFIITIMIASKCNVRTCVHAHRHWKGPTCFEWMVKWRRGLNICSWELPLAFTMTTLRLPLR